MIPYVDQLRELAALRNAGVLNEDDYVQQKEVLLALLRSNREEYTTRAYTEEELEEYTLRKNEPNVTPQNKLEDRTLVPEEALKDVISWEKGASIEGYELIKILGRS